MSTRNVINVWTLSLILASGLVATTPVHAQLCATPTAFASAAQPLPKSADWRKAISHENQDGGFAATRPKRERELKAGVAEFTKDIQDGSTPLMRTEFADGTDYDYVVETGGYGTHTVDRVEIRGVGAKAYVDATLLLPVSGHVGTNPRTGKPYADEWATTDLYDVTWAPTEYAKMGWNSGTHLIDGAQSLGYVSVQEVRIPLIKGQVVTVSYARRGSAGPGGYMEGRVIELIWDGT